NTGAGTHTFSVGDWTGAGSLIGVGNEVIQAVKNTNFTLTDSLISDSAGLSMSLTGFRAAQLTGGLGNNTLTVSGWTGAGSVNGGPGGTDILVSTKDADFTITDASVSATDGSTFTLVSLHAVKITGGAGNNTLDASSFTGTATLDGGAGD